MKNFDSGFSVAEREDSANSKHKNHPQVLSPDYFLYFQVLALSLLVALFDVSLDLEPPFKAKARWCWHPAI